MNGPAFLNAALFLRLSPERRRHLATVLRDRAEVERPPGPCLRADAAAATWTCRKIPSSTTHERRVTSGRPWRELLAWRFLRRARAQGPVVCGIWYPEGLVATLARIRPRVILAHGTELLFTPPAWRREAWRRMRRRVLESADLVVANSEYTRELVEAAAPRARVTSVPLGVDAVRFSPEGRSAARRKLHLEGKTVLSSVARLQHYRGARSDPAGDGGPPRRRT